MSDNDAPFRSVRGPIIDRVPFQRPGQPEVIKRIQFPDGPGDRRLYLEVSALEKLLEYARSSITNRAVIHGVVVEVEQIRTKDGHVYEVWAFVGHPAPEGSSLEDVMKGKPV